ncbi:DISARM system phospholipase D-like protein DrmC [Deinococcus yavapaiensis]|uniref:Phospholipase D-like protein n=1 Tax=Deinococcus yavapaiensis KR-236 TaxID=694435 RepID=A0A318S967_9DEIO|nr:DISARM system phospholipase D-like protein DrmC [Deinococcus yavapaiensis]PYE52976.1 phospholipase D-like protein [Deinococcus yavapaiensis KR-236]
MTIHTTSALWAAVARVATTLPIERVEQLAGFVQRAPGPRAIANALPGVPSDAVTALGVVWKDVPTSGAELASALRAAAATASAARRATDVSLAWTGPTTTFLSVRHTERVLVELVDAARERVFVASYVAYDVPSVVAALDGACARGVNVSILLETSAAKGGSLSVDSIEKMRAAVPRATLYEWNPTRRVGAVHAKAVVVDGAACLVTSANLTTAALERNMELGVTIRGGRVPEQLDRHFRALVDTCVLVRA